MFGPWFLDEYLSQADKDLGFWVLFDKTVDIKIYLF